MPVRIHRPDVHSEVVGSSVVPVDHPVDAVPEASQSIVRSAGEHMLVDGDRFACGHMPQSGPFAIVPANEGRLNAGQTIVKIAGKPVVTLAGSNISCSESAAEMANEATVILDRRPLVRINGSPVLSV